MKKKDILTKILAIAGTGLVWFPVLAPVLLSMVVFAHDRRFRFDFLVPAELFPLVLIGGGLLLWAALRRRARRGLIGGSLAVAAGMLIGGQVLAMVTGLASGETEPAGFWWGLVLASIFVYWLALLGMGVGGIGLLIDLFKPVPGLSESL
jgi:hypothetical protein